MRTICVAVLLLCVLCHSAAAEYFWRDLEVGKVGDFKSGANTYFKVRIVEVIDKDTMLMHLGENSRPAFLVKGFPTKGLVDDKRIELRGEWKCTDTKKHGGKTYYVIEPVKK